MLCNTYTQIKITKQKLSKLIIIKVALSVTYCQPQNNDTIVQYSHAVIGQIFMMAHLNTPFVTLIVTTRTMPYIPGCMSVITAVGKWRVAVLFSLSRMRMPGCRLRDILLQRWRCCRLWRYRVTNVARIIAIVFGRFTTWKVYCFWHQ